MSRKTDEADALNNSVFNDYYCRLRLLAVSRFEWVNLPDTCDERFLEKTLNEDGRAIFVNDPSLGFLSLRVTYAGSFNVYNVPTHYCAYSINYSKLFESAQDAGQCIRIRNNYLDLNTDFTLQLFARRLYEAERTANVNIIAQKTPVLLLCSEKERLTVQQLYKQWNGNEPFVVGDSRLMEGKTFSVLKTDAPYVADKCYEHKHQIWNEALSYLGISNNANQDKKERVITDEVTVNDEYTGLSGETGLLSRKQACKEINAMFGLNISVKMREYENATDEETEGDENGGEVIE